MRKPYIISWVPILILTEMDIMVRQELLHNSVFILPLVFLMACQPDRVNSRSVNENPTELKYQGGYCYINDTLLNGTVYALY